MKKNKLALFLLAAVLLFLLLIYGYFQLLQKAVPKDTVSPSPAPYPFVSQAVKPKTPRRTLYVQPKTLDDLPILPLEQGGGVDASSKIVKQSTLEIDKLEKALPFTQDFTSRAGITVSIVIPSRSAQDNPWTLLIQVFGIDYNTPKTSPDYKLMRDSFLEAANKALFWIEQQGANPKNIIISWGDKKLIRDTAQAWIHGN